MYDKMAQAVMGGGLQQKMLQRQPKQPPAVSMPSAPMQADPQAIKAAMQPMQPAMMPPQQTQMKPIQQPMASPPPAPAAQPPAAGGFNPMARFAQAAASHPAMKNFSGMGQRFARPGGQGMGFGGPRRQTGGWA